MVYFKVGGYVIGKKHLQALPYWLPSIGSYITAAAIGFCWIADIKVIMDKVPIYRNKFAYPYEDDKIVYIEPKYKI
ncbi:hypothetical protein PGB90_001712 [Kerria lacca]